MKNNMRIIKKIGIFLVFILFIGIGKAQNVVIQQDPKVGKLVEEHKKANTKVGVIEGFRIQIFFDSGNNSKGNAEAAKSKFAAQYPTISVYLTFKEPNFRVRVGDFRTRNEARGFLKQISTEYPNAFVIKDEIKLPPLTQPSVEKTNE